MTKEMKPCCHFPRCQHCRGPEPSAGLSERTDGFDSLVGKEIPADELADALRFEEFNSKEEMMFGWRRVHRELHVVATAYRRLLATQPTSSPDPEREAMETIIEDYRRLLDMASDVDVEIMCGYLSTLDRVRSKP